MRTSCGERGRRSGAGTARSRPGGLGRECARDGARHSGDLSRPQGYTCGPAPMPLSHAHDARLGARRSGARPNYGERMPTSPDVAVVGGGIAGASVAYELAATRSVVLLEAEATLGSHSTARSAATWIPGARRRRGPRPDHGLGTPVRGPGRRVGGTAAPRPRPVLVDGVRRRRRRRRSPRRSPSVRASRTRPSPSTPTRPGVRCPAPARDPRRGAHRDGRRRRRRRPARRLPARAAGPWRDRPHLGPGRRASPRRHGLAGGPRGRRRAARRRDRRRGGGVGGPGRGARRRTAARAHAAAPDDRGGPGAGPGAAAAAGRRAAADGVRRDGSLVLQGRRTASPGLAGGRDPGRAGGRPSRRARRGARRRAGRGGHPAGACARS